MIEQRKIFCDYTKKIGERFYILKNKDFSDDVNSLLILLNFCFIEKNNFFVNEYNNKNVKDVQGFYNSLKSNILNKELLFTEEHQLFEKINKFQVKNVIFILKNYVYNFNNIFTEQTLKDEKLLKIKEICTQQKMRNLLKVLKTL